MHTSEEEKKRRFKVLSQSDTLREAAEELDISYTGIQQWSQKHYPDHHKKFGRDCDVTGGRIAGSKLDMYRRTLRDVIHDLESPAVGDVKDRVARRRINMAVGELEWMLNDLNTRLEDEE